MKKVLTIIIGAGASYDSAPINAVTQAQQNKWRPPLTANLFAANSPWSEPINSPVRMHGDLLPIIERIRRETKKSTLEAALLQLKQEVGEYPERWRQILAIQDWITKVISECTKNWSRALGNATSYIDLLARLGDWAHQNDGVLNFITFNYDTLLESASCIIQNKGPLHGDFDRYLSGKYKIFKPHGSIDWWHEVTFDSGRKSVGDGPLSEKEKNTLKLYGGTKKDGVTTSADGVTTSMPAISVPVATKDHNDFILPPGHFKEMQSALKKTDAFLVIGWAGNEGHFMSEVKTYVKESAPTFVECGDRGEDTVNNLNKFGKIHNTNNSGLGFAKFLDGDDLEEWLNKI